MSIKYERKYLMQNLDHHPIKSSDESEVCTISSVQRNKTKQKVELPSTRLLPYYIRQNSLSTNQPPVDQMTRLRLLNELQTSVQ